MARSRPALGGFVKRFGAARAHVQRSGGKRLNVHRRAAQQYELPVQALLFEKALFHRGPQRAVPEGLARRTEKNLGPLLRYGRGMRERDDQKSQCESKTKKHPSS
jgi:hypothetical protein